MAILGFAALLLGRAGFFSALPAEPRPALLVSLGLLYLIGLGGFLAGVGFWVVRPLRDTERSAQALSRGELQRPIALSVPATLEVHNLQRVFEEVRRALITKLRSSTELNLQLESEVARRSAELQSRNAELSVALDRLRATLDELVRTEKLAAVGRIAAGVTTAINQPLDNLTESVQKLQNPLTMLLGDIDNANATNPKFRGEFAAFNVTLERILHSALRIRDVVRALRVYARPQESSNPNKPKPAEVIFEDVLRLVEGQGQAQAHDAVVADAAPYPKTII